MPDQDQAQPAVPPSRGIRLQRGTRLRLSNLSFSIAPDGSVASDVSFSVAVDFTPYWLEIAADQVALAEERHTALLDALHAENEDRMDAAMQRECKASMQAMAAAAIALDAFYGVVKDMVELPTDLEDRWKEKRTARYRQVTEVLRRAFQVPPRSAVTLRADLREIFKWRDRAVHPSGVPSNPVRYAELSVDMDWRFVAFRAENARIVTAHAIKIVAQLLAAPRKGNAELSDFCGPALKNLQPVLHAWEDRFGALAR